MTTKFHVCFHIVGNRVMLCLSLTPKYPKILLNDNFRIVNIHVCMDVTISILLSLKIKARYTCKIPEYSLPWVMVYHCHIVHFQRISQSCSFTGETYPQERGAPNQSRGKADGVVVRVDEEKRSGCHSVWDPWNWTWPITRLTRHARLLPFCLPRWERGFAPL